MLSTPTNFSLYIHLPWCVKKCPYCDFNSHPLKQTLPEQAYLQALWQDFAYSLPFVQNRQLSSIFFGGGTPSLISAQGLLWLLEQIKSTITFTDNLEITLEANPGTAEAQRFIEYYQIGINRLSIGAQSFNNQQLQQLGRIHNSQQIHQAVLMAKQAGFRNINLDLMFALPQQTTEQALLDINTAIALQPTHISHYQLTIEPNTYFYHNPPSQPTDEQQWQQQTQCQQRLQQAGYRQYEVSTYSQANYQCQHNLNYWQFGDYLGIGAGAHSKLTYKQQIHRFSKTKHPTSFIDKAGTEQGLSEQKTLSIPNNAQEIVFEFMLNHLRLKQGFDIKNFTQTTGLDYKSYQPKIKQLMQQGYLQQHGETITTTTQGWQFLNQLLLAFL